MKPPTTGVRKAAVKRFRAEASSRAREQAPAPKRHVTRASSSQALPPIGQREPLPAPEVDLTADTPSDEARVAEVVVGPATTESPVRDEQPTIGADRSWGEGPSGASPLPEQPPAGSPPRPDPEPAEHAEEARARPLPGRASLMNDGRLAERLLASAVQPEFQEELRSVGVNRFFREVFSSLVWVTNSVALTREALFEGEALARQIQSDAEEARARAEAAERALESARAECAERIKEAEAEASRKLSEAESAVEARNLHITDLEAALKEAEDRAKQAEEGISLKEADRAATADSLVEEKKARAAAEAKAIAAVEDFKRSDSFVHELTEANAEFYVQGFKDARKKIARVLNIHQARDIEPDLESEDASDSEPTTDS